MLFLTDLKQQGPLPGPVMTAAAALPTDKTKILIAAHLKTSLMYNQNAGQRLYLRDA